MSIFSTSSATTARERDIEKWYQLDRDAFDDYEIVRVYPYARTDGVEAGIPLMSDFYKSPRQGRLRRGSKVPTYCFDIKGQRGTFEFTFGLDTSTAGSTDLSDMRGWITTRYPDSTIEPIESIADEFVTIPHINPGDSIAGGHVTLAENCIKPLRHLQSASDRLEDDPFNSILPDMGGGDARSMLQVVFRPASKSWYSHGKLINGEQATTESKEKRVKGWFDPEVETKTVTKSGSSDIAQQERWACFKTDINLLAVSEDPDDAAHRVEQMVDMFSDLTNPKTGQEVNVKLKSGTAMRTHVSQMLERTIRTRSRTGRFLAGPSRILTYPELAMFVHLSSRECKYPVNIPGVDYSEMSEGPGVPPSADQPPIQDRRQGRGRPEANSANEQAGGDVGGR